MLYGVSLCQADTGLSEAQLFCCSTMFGESGVAVLGCLGVVSGARVGGCGCCGWSGWLWLCVGDVLASFDCWFG